MGHGARRGMLRAFPLCACRGRDEGGCRRLFHHQAGTLEAKAQISRRKLGPRASCRSNPRLASEAKFANRKENRAMNIPKRLGIAALLALFFSLTNSTGILDAQDPSGANQPSGQETPVSVPVRAAGPLYKGDQGTQKSEIKFA